MYYGSYSEYKRIGPAVTNIARQAHDHLQVAYGSVPGFWPKASGELVGFCGAEAPNIGYISCSDLSVDLLGNDDRLKPPSTMRN